MPTTLFLDRDGTLIVDRHYLSDPADVELLPGVRESLHDALRAGHKLFLFTNQSGVARGFFTLREVDACNRRMLKLLDLPPPGFTSICNAIDPPESTDGYRKPSPRFILESIAAFHLDPNKCWMIGDKPSDVEAGQRAGIRSAFIAAVPHHSVSSAIPRFPNLASFLRSASIRKALV